MSWRDAISWHEEGQFSSSKYIFTQTKSTTQNFDMKNFIITIFLIFAIGKAGGKGNSSELSEGIMHYFHSYALFSHKKLTWQLSLRRGVWRITRTKFANIRKGIGFSCSFVSRTAAKQVWSSLLLQYSAVTKSKDISKIWSVDFKTRKFSLLL